MAAPLEQLAVCIERGKVDADSPYPPELRGQEGAVELTRRALAAGLSPQLVLQEGLECSDVGQERPAPGRREPVAALGTSPLEALLFVDVAGLEELAQMGPEVPVGDVDGLAELGECHPLRREQLGDHGEAHLREEELIHRRA